MPNPIRVRHSRQGGEQSAFRLALHPGRPERASAATGLAKWPSLLLSSLSRDVCRREAAGIYL